MYIAEINTNSFTAKYKRKIYHAKMKIHCIISQKCALPLLHLYSFIIFKCTLQTFSVANNRINIHVVQLSEYYELEINEYGYKRIESAEFKFWLKGNYQNTFYLSKFSDKIWITVKLVFLKLLTKASTHYWNVNFDIQIFWIIL